MFALRTPTNPRTSTTPDVNLEKTSGVASGTQAPRESKVRKSIDQWEGTTAEGELRGKGKEGKDYKSQTMEALALRQSVIKHLGLSRTISSPRGPRLVSECDC
ncbi:unnamed protein product [Pieris brassicae]|uniref:Uncharacterized protein n=1 Tax=Pieris brassicae TaxID=7116 RepID=A0A9P0TY46_PIEBR|nr:unnamed protein product [Pieris brassicae]